MRAHRLGRRSIATQVVNDGGTAAGGVSRSACTRRAALQRARSRVRTPVCARVFEIGRCGARCEAARQPLRQLRPDLHCCSRAAGWWSGASRWLLGNRPRPARHRLRRSALPPGRDGALRVRHPPARARGRRAAGAACGRAARAGHKRRPRHARGRAPDHVLRARQGKVADETELDVERVAAVHFRLWAAGSACTGCGSQDGRGTAGQPLARARASRPARRPCTRSIASSRPKGE